MIAEKMHFSWFYPSKAEETGTYTCSVCSSTDVEGLGWVKMNEDSEPRFTEIAGNTEDFYCCNCKEKREVLYVVSLEDSVYTGETVCNVLSLDEKTLASASAFCGERDSFNKDAGRKVSLTKVLDKLTEKLMITAGPSEKKEFRTKIWNAYYQLKHKNGTEAKSEGIVST